MRGCNDHRADLETGQMEWRSCTRFIYIPSTLRADAFEARGSLKDAARIGSDIGQRVLVLELRADSTSRQLL